MTPWKPYCAILETGILYDLEKASPMDLVDDAVFTQLFGIEVVRGKPDVPTRVRIYGKYVTAVCRSEALLARIRERAAPKQNCK